MYLGWGLEQNGIGRAQIVITGFLREATPLHQSQGVLTFNSKMQSWAGCVVKISVDLTPSLILR